MPLFTMLAPTPGHLLTGCASGNVYVADASGIVPDVQACDLLCMLNMGCTILYSNITGDPTMTYVPNAVAYAPIQITSNTFTLTALNDEVLVNKTTPSATAIPISAMNVDHPYQYKDQAQNSASYPITLTTSMGDGKIDGQNSAVLNVNGESLTLIFNGTTTNIT